MSQQQRPSKSSVHNPKPQQQEVLLAARYSGPLPDPHTLSDYEKVQPGFAERLLCMAEKEQSHRHHKETEHQQIERSVVEQVEREHIRDTKSFRRGQTCAVISVGMVLILCGFMVGMEYAEDAKWVAISVLAALAGVFITNRLSGSDQKKQKKESGASNNQQKSV